METEKPIWKTDRPIRDAYLLENRDGLVATALGGEDAVRRHKRNDKGRDFVVSDIHARYPDLENCLEELEFDTDKDRLFPVGDLIDHGPNSEDALDWMLRPWFLPIRGNHDQLLLDADADPDHEDGQEWDCWIDGNGGRWWRRVPTERRARFVETFKATPFAREVECDLGLVGIVHADVPMDLDWASYMDALRTGSRLDCLYALWARDRYRILHPNLYRGLTEPEPNAKIPDVEGDIDMIICGHSPVIEPERMGKIWLIDTNAGRGGKLTFARIHPGELELTSFPVETDEKSGGGLF